MSVDPRLYTLTLRALQKHHPAMSDAERAALASMIVGAGDVTLANATTIAFGEAVKAYAPSLPSLFTHSHEAQQQDRRADAQRRLATMPTTTDQQKIRRAMEAERLALESQAADAAARATDGPRADVRDVVRSFASNSDQAKVKAAMDAEARVKAAIVAKEGK